MNTQHQAFAEARLEQMRRYAAQLAADRTRKQAVEQKRQPPAKLDYVALIQIWWNSMPPSVRQHPWSLEVIAAAAFSGQTRRPAMRHVAAALRILGFKDRRDWSNAGRNRRLWVPTTPSISIPLGEHHAQINT
jgi:hypothetical protein